VSQLKKKETQNNAKEKERPNSMNKKQLNAATTTISEKMKFGCESRMGKSRAKDRAPLLKKYKFIPTLAFKHN
jgi:hypothetical protein